MRLVREGDLYSIENLIVAPNPPQDVLADFYLQGKADSSLKYFCYENIPILSDFLYHFSKPNTLSFAAFVKGDTMEVAGLGRVHLPYGDGGPWVRAEIDIGFLRRFQRRQYTIPFAQMMIQWVFDRATVDGLYGTTPEFNRAMLAFIDALQFKRTAEPVENFAIREGKPCGVYLSWMTKQRWDEVSPFKETDAGRPKANAD